MLRFAFLLILATLAHCRHEVYEGHKLFSLSGPVEVLTEYNGPLDFLTASRSRQDANILDAMVKLSPDQEDNWLRIFEEKGIKWRKVADNLADFLRAVDTEMPKTNRAVRDNSSTITWDRYYRYQEINDYLDRLGQEYPELVTVVDAALSYEGRVIKYIKISTTNFTDESKPVIIIDSTTHANEWISTPVATYIIDRLVEQTSDRHLVEQIDWIIVPVVNPDGFEFTFERARLWRKTRSRDHSWSTLCPGVDINRNYDIEWGTGNRANPCAVNYEGPEAFSEVETRVVRDIVLSNIDRTAMYLSLHSFGSMLLYAWGTNGTLPSNGLFLHLAGVRMADAIGAAALPDSEPYIVGNSALTLYTTTGTSRDWTRAAGIPLTYTLELPGRGLLTGFIVPERYIQQIVEETWAGIKAGAEYVIETN